MADKEDTTTPALIRRRFWSKVDIRGPNECWPWTAGCRESGVGRFRLGGRGYYAPRLVWQWAVGPIPKGLCVCHACDRPACCNLKHLWLGTRAENNADKMRKGRHRVARGEAQGNSKLTAADAREILVRKGTQRLEDTALEFGVAISRVGSIQNGQTWGWATGASPVYPGKARGERNGSAKLTEDEVREIFAVKNQESRGALAARFRVSTSAISKIVNGRNWRHITGAPRWISPTT